MLKTNSRRIETLRRHARPLTETPEAYDELLASIGDARFVLIGEASHGTHEFYRERAALTKRLIREKGFAGVAVEADWPDSYEVNRYVRHLGEARSATEALSGFKRFPSWMWRNQDVLDFINWLHHYNAPLSPDTRVGFYGLDLYSLFTSIQAVIHYLEKIDPSAANRARERYACFDHFGEDPQAYGYASSMGVDKNCIDEVISELTELQRRAFEYRHRDGHGAEEDFFSAEQNARVIKNAEEYYRCMFKGRTNTWNMRDKHMVQTLDILSRYLQRYQKKPKIVVWAHNSHLGNARFTEMGWEGQFNIGQLMKEAYGQEVYNIGFSTYTGTVTAASFWDGPTEQKRINPGRHDSYEGLFHEIGIPNYLLLIRDNPELVSILKHQMLERAIGVIYAPETERISHYFKAELAYQFDAMIHIDETHAVQPLDATSEPVPAAAAETFPSAL